MIFDCKELAQNHLKKLKAKTNRSLSLGVIQVGRDKVSKVYINEKRKAAENLDLDFNHYRFPSSIQLKKLKKEIGKFTDDGLIVQLPIKGNLDTQEVLNLIPFEKDIDCLSEVSVGKMVTGRLDILPPVVGAVDKILKANNLKLEERVVAVIGPGRLVGKPMISYTINKGGSVVTIDENTQNSASLIKRADIVVTGVGEPNLITGKMIKRGAAIIDAGTTKKEGEVVGDVDMGSVREKAGLITPVPGGVGPLTVASLLENLIKRKNGN